MAINRYRGNSGVVQRIEDGEDVPSRELTPLQNGNFYRQRPAQPPQNIRPPRLPLSGDSGGQGMLKGLGDTLEKSLGGVFSKVKSIDLETEDIILLLIIYLMYKENKDEQLLIIMGLMLFL